MTNIEKAKEKLQKDGYTHFNIKDFDENFYNYLLPFKCSEEKNLKNFMHNLRADYGNGKSKVNIQDKFESFEKASEKKKEILNFIKTNKVPVQQVWFFHDSIRDILGEMFYSELRTNRDWYEIIENEYSVYKNFIYKIVRYLFDFDNNQKFVLFSPTLTYYDTDCELGNHSDGTTTARICALLIYLNETYDETDGGLLILNNKEKVIPTFGNIAIIDLQSFDIPHQVTKVTNGIGRYAFLSFVKTKENEFIMNTEELKK